MDGRPAHLLERWSMASRKKCPKCGAGNESEATTCSLCNEPLAANRQTLTAFELEPRQWTGAGQRRRGDKSNDGDAAAAASAKEPPPVTGAPLRSVARVEPAAPAPAPVPSGVQSSPGHYLLPPVGGAQKLETNI